MKPTMTLTATARRLALCAAPILSGPCLPQAHGQAADPANLHPYANRYDQALAGVFEAREQDWRDGAIVYQVLVDRFAPSARLEQKKGLYPAPKVLHRWSDVPRRGTYQPSVNVWSHEIDFWGGDLQSVAARLDYIHGLGADVLYLNPIHLAYTNHKYDALDYMKVSPEFGTRDDLRALTRDVHALGMKIVLDGVFNHMGRNAAIFKQAAASPASPYRDWFVFGPQYPGGARAWAKAENLPELNLENPKVREYLYGGPDSVVQSYLRDGIDGWRLDVAYEIGPAFLAELTAAAHRSKPGSLVVGEIANYPKEWFPSVDGVLDFTLRDIILQTAAGRIDAPTAARMLDRTIEEAGIEPMLKSWLMLDNHDTPRLATVLPATARRHLAQLLQFTLPGSPNLYYGSELGMTGGEDPEMRAPMRWDLVTRDNAELSWTRKLIALRKQHRALRIGNFRLVTAGKLLAFERYTDRVQDTVVVLANPGSSKVTEGVLIANSKLMNGALMTDLLGERGNGTRIMAAMTTVTLPAGAFLVLAPDVTPDAGYTPFKRVQ